MTTLAHYQTLFAYQAATFTRLLDGAAKLDEAAYKHHAPFRLGSLHDTLFHVLAWLNWWRESVQGRVPTPGLQAEAYPTLADLRAGLAHEQAAWQAVLAGLRPADLEAEYTVSGGTFVLWRILQHVTLHSMQHFSEAAAMLTALGYPPGAIDFIWYTG